MRRGLGLSRRRTHTLGRRTNGAKAAQAVPERELAASRHR